MNGALRLNFKPLAGPDWSVVPWHGICLSQEAERRRKEDRARLDAASLVVAVSDPACGLLARKLPQVGNPAAMKQ
jgi:hypothetical protein